MADLLRLSLLTLVVVACKSGGGASVATPVPAAPEQQVGLATVPDSVVAGCPRDSAELGMGEHPYFDFMVSRPARLVSQVTAEAPPELAGRHGEVVMQYVVDTTGAVEFGTVKMVKGGSAADSAFAKIACRSLALTLYRPADIDRQLVRMWVEQPFKY